MSSEEDKTASPPPRTPSSPGAIVPGTGSARIDPMLGTVLDDRYRIIRHLGTGGMATVYLGEHMFIGRKVAVKVLHPQLAADENFVRRFLNEGRAAGTLGHPNIVASTDMGTTPLGQPYLVLEYLEGRDLAAVIERDGALPVVRASRIAVQVASGLASAHAAKIIHRDLKAENIFLIARPDKRDEVRVIDFGISKFGATQSTQAGMLVGTPQYMSPEQLIDPSGVDERADIYALGVIVFQMLTGRLPFNDPTIPGLIAKINTETAPELTKIAPSVPVGLAKLVRSALAKNPGDRPGSMGAFEEQVSQFANMSSTSIEASGVPFLPPPAKKKSPVVPIAAAAAAVLIAVAVMVLRPWEKREAPPAPAPAPVVVAPPPAPKPEPKLEPKPEPKPEPPRAPAPVTSVHFIVMSEVKKARVAFRGRVYPLPLEVDVKPGTAPESIEVTAPGYAGKRFWITFDQAAMDLMPKLTKGSGVSDATETETIVALGNAPPDSVDVRQPAAAKKPAAVVAEAKPEPAPQPAPTPAPEPVPAPPPAPAPPVVAPGEEIEDVKMISNPFEVPELRNAINMQIGSLRACTEKAQGSATITVEVAADGSVSNASANAGPGNGKIAACLIRTVRKWSFAKQPVPKTRFAFPLILG